MVCQSVGLLVIISLNIHFHAPIRALVFVSLTLFSRQALVYVLVIINWTIPFDKNLHKYDTRCVDLGKRGFLVSPPQKTLHSQWIMQKVVRELISASTSEWRKVSWMSYWTYRHAYTWADKVFRRGALRSLQICSGQSRFKYCLKFIFIYSLILVG